MNAVAASLDVNLGMAPIRRVAAEEIACRSNKLYKVRVWHLEGDDTREVIMYTSKHQPSYKSTLACTYWRAH